MNSNFKINILSYLSCLCNVYNLFQIYLSKGAIANVMERNLKLQLVIDYINIYIYITKMYLLLNKNPKGFGFCKK